jgi:hypothetical protein
VYLPLGQLTQLVALALGWNCPSLHSKQYWLACVAWSFREPLYFPAEQSLQASIEVDSPLSSWFVLFPPEQK